jgi:hypothetical protein
MWLEVAAGRACLLADVQGAVAKYSQRNAHF